uniref:hypothetical protein n=2 Tax=Clostridium botulinum TaxID=1491 RepID=UPI0034D97271
MGLGIIFVMLPSNITKSIASKNIKRYIKIPIQCELIQLIIFLTSRGMGKNANIIDTAINMYMPV